MKLLVDTNVLIRFFADDEPFAEMIERADDIVIHPAVYAEFLSGIDQSTKSGKRQRQVLEEFLDAPAVSLATVTSVTALYYAKIYRYLKSVGKMLPKNDIWIAASALEHGWEVVTHDSDFEQIPMINLMELPPDLPS